MSWWEQPWVKIWHKPTGLIVVSDYGGSRSQYKAWQRAMQMLRGKIWSVTRGGYFLTKDKLVRGYTDQDFDRLDITEMKREERIVPNQRTPRGYK